MAKNDFQYGEWGRVSGGGVPGRKRIFCYRYFSKLAPSQCPSRLILDISSLPWSYRRSSNDRGRNCKYAKSWTARFPISDCTLRLDCTLKLYHAVTLLQCYIHELYRHGWTYHHTLYVHHLHGKPPFLVFPCRTLWQYSHDDPPRNGVECSWVVSPVGLWM